MVGDNPHFPPARGQQRFNPVHQAGDQFGNSMGQPTTLLVAGRVQITELGPGAAGGFADFVCRQDLIAFILQELAESVGCQVFAAWIDAGPELLARVGPSDFVGDWRERQAWRLA